MIPRSGGWANLHLRPRSPGGSLAWTPADLTGLDFWWNAQRVTSDPGDSNPLDTLEDLSGNGYDGSASGTARATWTDDEGGYPGLVFTTDDYYALPSALAALHNGTDAPFIRVYVYTAGTAASNMRLGAVTLSTTVKDFIQDYLQEFGAGGKTAVSHRDDSNVLVSASAGSIVTSGSIVCVRHGTTADLYVSGTKIVDGGAYDNGAATFDQATVGAQAQATPGGFLDATLREVIWATPASIDADEITSLLDYLAAEWA